MSATSSQPAAFQWWLAFLEGKGCVAGTGAFPVTRKGMILTCPCMSRQELWENREAMKETVAESGLPQEWSDPALAEVVRRLVAAYQPERVYLFGSKARGDSGPDSDYDLMVIVPDDAPPERRRSRLAYQALRGTGTAADVLVWLKSNFDRRLHVVASLPATVAREGRLLYGS